MSSAVLLGMGEMFYGDDYTATPNDVILGKTFIGKGSEERQTGTVPNNRTINKQLQRNETYNIPVGKNDGIHITQNISTMSGQTINPGRYEINIYTQGMVMTGDVVVNAVSNLIASNIKKNVVVGGVTGTFEGYVD